MPLYTIENLPTDADSIAWLFPSYTGSKKKHSLDPTIAGLLNGRDIYEPFAGTASLSYIHANRALWVEKDAALAWALAHYDELTVPEVWTKDDHDRIKLREGWEPFIYCLMSSMFNGYYRVNQKGIFNSPSKGDYKAKALLPDYARALNHWYDLAPEVIHSSYEDISNSDIKNYLSADAIVVFDPPYEGSKTQYAKGMNFTTYWGKVRETVAEFPVLVFDFVENLVAAGVPIDGKRVLNSFATHEGRIEGWAYLPAGTKFGLLGNHVAKKPSRPIRSTGSRSAIDIVGGAR